MNYKKTIKDIVIIFIQVLAVLFISSVVYSAYGFSWQWLCSCAGVIEIIVCDIIIFYKADYIKLPCSIGDTVYLVLEDSFLEEGFYISEEKVFDVSVKGVYIKVFIDDDDSDLADFVPYEKINFTKEEAKKQLRKRFEQR